MIKLATIFSGIGSIEHALQRLNIPYEIVFACDIDKFVKQSYFANYDIDDSRWYSDIHDLDAKKYKNKVDILVGGSPCQSFSMVGKRKGLDDHRGQLVFEFCRIVQETQPKMFIFENVKGLLNHDSGKTWNIVLEEFKKLGYNFDFQMMNSRDYGIPQNRERVFLVAFRNKQIKYKFPKKIELKLTMQDLLEDNPDPKYYLKEKGIKFVTKQKNLDKRYTQINGNIALCQKANQQFNWHGDFILESPKEDVDPKYYLSEKVAKYVTSPGTKNYKTCTKTDLPIARPILSTVHKMHRAGVDNYITKENKIRKLTPRECLRLMGFDDRFKIAVSDTQMYKQAGNSIVVNNFIEILKNIDFDEVFGDNNGKS